MLSPTMPSRYPPDRLLGIALAFAMLPTSARSAEAPSSDTLQTTYSATIQPLLARYCHECHSPEHAEAELDFTRLATWDDVRRHPGTWQKVADMLDSAQMPPPEAKQPVTDEHRQLQRWVHDLLMLEAQRHAGDPGRVVLRRLNNAEYTYTLRDLTSVSDLDPAREFPVDGAAGEGFTNSGAALVMSPALLTKYLDAGKQVAAHAVLLPDGFRFSPATTRRDWTEEILAEIRGFYRQFTDPGGAESVNLQGIVFNTNEGGRLPLEKYLRSLWIERQALATQTKSIEQVAQAQGLSPKYLNALNVALAGGAPSLLLDPLRAQWKSATVDDLPAMAAYLAAWQKALWKFSTVGHIGKVGGPKAWLEPVSPLAEQQEFRLEFPAAGDEPTVTFSLVASDAGDGSGDDLVQWHRPRLVAPGRPELLLRDVRHVVRQRLALRSEIFAHAERYLLAADEATRQSPAPVLAELAARHQVEPDALALWLAYLGIGETTAVDVQGHFTQQITGGGGYEFIQGWGSGDTPNLVSNASDQPVRIPGNMPPHAVAVHPSPTHRAAVGWQSPYTGRLTISGSVTHAHPECGNGVTWTLEFRRGATRRTLAEGVSHGGQPVAIGPITDVAVRSGDLVSLAIGPRDGNHACDLTNIALLLAPAGGDPPAWNLADDVADDIRAANPHADRQGHSAVWHFYTEPESAAPTAPVIPSGSLLARWQESEDLVERRRLATAVQQLLLAEAPAEASPDAALYRQLASLGGPLLGRATATPNTTATPHTASSTLPHDEVTSAAADARWGLDPALFGRHPRGAALDADSLCVSAPAVLTCTLPADLAAGCALITTGSLEAQAGDDASVQLDVVDGEPTVAQGLVASEVDVAQAGGAWTDNNQRIKVSAPILVRDGSAARRRVETALDEFRQLFPAALCYAKIVPVDEVVTLTLFYREDDHLRRLMLDDTQAAHLDRLWNELHFVSQDALTLVDAFAQLMEYATQDADPKVFEPLREPILQRAAEYRQRLLDAEPAQLDALLAFAARAFRRPLTESDTAALRRTYRALREEDLSHEDAVRATLASIFVAPAFLYRLEKPTPGTQAAPVNPWELATRLSYFLWSSAPDDRLRTLAENGTLVDPEVLVQELQRMLADPRCRRLALEFACQWLHIRDFDQLDEKSERHFPEFASLRGAMAEESIQFFTHFFQDNRSVLDILLADDTFLNEDLARHYGIADVTGPEWRRVMGLTARGRGGILGQASILAKQSGASRTSPILRGNWVSEVLLGERLPRPPKGVPVLPDDGTATAELSVRQLTERHATEPVCAGCHRRIDPLGFALESFDAIGQLRERDAEGRAIDTRAQTIDGAEFTGLAGLRDYLRNTRRDAFVRQFSRKLLGYALGRSIQLSDEPLLAELQAQLAAQDYRVHVALETIVRSRQFREMRGRDAPEELTAATD